MARPRSVAEADDFTIAQASMSTQYALYAQAGVQ